MRLTRLIVFVSFTIFFASAMANAQTDSIQRNTCLKYESAVVNAGKARQSRSFQKAITEIRPLLQQNPNCFNLNRSLGLTFAEQGDFKQAIFYLKKAGELIDQAGSDDNGIYNSLGWAYMLDGDYSNAEEKFTRAQSEEIWQTLKVETKLKVLNNSGLLYIYMGRYDEAEKYLNRATNEYGSVLAKNNLMRLQKMKAQRASSK